MSTEYALSALQELPEAPWAEVAGGKPLNARGLAKRLAGYDVKSKNIRAGEKVFRGYARADLADAWEWYLPPLDVADTDDDAAVVDDMTSRSPRENATSAASATPTPAESLIGGAYPHSEAGFRPENGRARQPSLTVTTPPQSATSVATSVGPDPDVARVADVTDFRGGGENDVDGEDPELADDGPDHGEAGFL